MPIWNGEIWVCEVEGCRTVNAILRKRCRSCGVNYPGPMHPDPQINASLQAEMRDNIIHDRNLGIR